MQCCCLCETCNIGKGTLGRGHPAAPFVCAAGGGLTPAPAGIPIAVTTTNNREFKLAIQWEQVVAVLTLGGVYWTAWEQRRIRLQAIARPPPAITCDLDRTNRPPRRAIMMLHVSTFGPAAIVLESLSAPRWSGLRLASTHPMRQVDAFGHEQLTGPLPQTFTRCLDLRLRSDGTARQPVHGRVGIELAARLPRRPGGVAKLIARYSWADAPGQTHLLKLQARL